MSPFVFATCQVGAERALKGEAQRVRALRPAFMRPGFVTFKSDAPLTLPLEVDLALARVVGLSLGHVKSSDVATRAKELAAAHGPLRLHVWERDRFAPSEVPDDEDRQGKAIALAAALVHAHPKAFLVGNEAAAGDRVLDVVGTDDDVWYLGMHIHRAHTSPSPGGDPRLAIPADAPSRAWAKLEQAVRAFDIPLRSGDRVVEVGAAPGGVSYALLVRGCHVIAVDPAKMDPRLAAFAHFEHVPTPVSELAPGSVAHPVRWVVLDINISPFAALRQLEKLVREHADDLYGLVLTLKLGDWAMAARIPHLVAIVSRLGAPLHEVRARQLPANKVEVCVVGLTAAGIARRSAKP